MLDWLGPSTPYRLKRVLASTVEDFFPVPHTSLYVEPARLAAAGLLDEEREAGGRRRTTYALNDRGRAALRAWLDEPATEPGVFRFPGILKLFFGADPAAFAGEQVAHHRALAERFERDRDLARSRGTPLTPQREAVLNTGIRLHRWWEATWEDLGRRAEGWRDTPPQ